MTQIEIIVGLTEENIQLKEKIKVLEKANYETKRLVTKISEDGAKVCAALIQLYPKYTKLVEQNEKLKIQLAYFESIDWDSYH